ncbi:uncharacterized protein LOC124949577 isoform X2 [Vespa velutina]|uniref:uncharacterized protein LOC124949577 isoform X2 n=2 Tax=Vespa velutina TaxID=202808 RepID=UPI001FB493E7|nr:uncharacterized protein LOC124949577 isoform X2 [Vespa velutina]
MIVEDTVISIEREPREMTMEAILLRDQRTTSHRVLNREDQSVAMTTTMTTTMTKMKTTKEFIKEGNDRQISRLLDHPSSSSRICRSTCCARACYRNCCHCSSCGNDDVSAQRHFRRDSDVCRARASSSCDDDRGVRSRRCLLSITTTTWLRLSSLVVTLLVASVNGAPTMTVNARRLSSPPKWVNPCGLAAEDFDSDPDVEQLRDVQLLTQVVVQAKTALMHAQLFRDDYIKRTFKVDFADWHLQWKDNHYDWLPSKKDIPKQLGEQLQQQYLDSLELDRSLLDAYEYMQKYAVGLEQIVWDQEDNGLEFRDQFKDTEFKLRTVLCELQVALMERAVTLRPDVTRNAMSTEYRSMSSSATYRDLRDWLIFRDYMNGLEYVVQVFEHLRRGLES